MAVGSDQPPNFNSVTGLRVGKNPLYPPTGWPPGTYRDDPGLMRLARRLWLDSQSRLEKRDETESRGGKGWALVGVESSWNNGGCLQNARGL